MKNALARSILSLVVPPLCAACWEPEVEGALCGRCRSGLIPLPAGRCGRCGAPGPARTGPGACRECRGRALAFDSAWAAFAYEGVARSLVAALKSRGMTAAAALMGAELAARAPDGTLRGTLVPVPAHRGRQFRSGFNPAAAIARAAGRAAGLPVRELLERRSGGAPQAGLGRGERLGNARGTIRAIRAGRHPPGPLVLVDDVYTTGSTLDACARALREAGVAHVRALTFARAVRSRPCGRGP